MFVQSFNPISKSNASILILGTVPGKESFRREQYYAHPRNIFWKLMQHLLGFRSGLSYENRCSELSENGIALWDVLQCCTRTSSLDSDIVEDSVVTNDIAGFLRIHSMIGSIYFNGAKAEKVFKKYVAADLPNLSLLTIGKLPSTSPAYASMPYNRKLELWSSITTGV